MPMIQSEVTKVGMRLRVCALDEIIDDELVSFEVLGVTIPILVTRVEGEIIAGSSMCPHEDVSLTSGRIDGSEIVCKAHGYAFDVKTGECSHDSSLRWRTYRTVIIGSELFVDLI